MIDSDLYDMTDDFHEIKFNKIYSRINTQHFKQTVDKCTTKAGRIKPVRS